MGLIIAYFETNSLYKNSIYFLMVLVDINSIPVDFD
jgi:hypothetical protein